MADTNPPQPSKNSTTSKSAPSNVGGVSYIQNAGEPPSEPRVEAETVREELKRAGVTTTADAELASTITQRAKNILQPLRTYRDDVASVLKRTKGSKVSIKTAEAERERKLLSEARERAKKELFEREEAARLKEREATLKVKEEKLQQEREARREQDLKTAEATEVRAQENVVLDARGKRKTIEEQQQAFLERQRQEEVARNQQQEEQQRQLVAEQKLKEEQNRIKAEAERLQQEQEVRREGAVNQVAAQATATSQAEKKPRSTTKTLLVSVLFIVVGVSILSLTYVLFFKEDVRPPQITLDTLILAEENVDIDITGLSGESLVLELASAKDAVGTPGDSVVNFTPLERTNNSEAERKLAGSFFFERLVPEAPEELSRSLGDTYMLGLFVGDVRQMFLIVRPTFYENAFAGMLEWEATMADNLSPLFQKPTRLSSSVSATSSTRSRALIGEFEDKIIDNKDTRVLLDENGDVAFLYSFVTRETLIIADGKEAFLEVFERMSAKKVSN